MRVIAYCDECMDCFSGLPYAYWSDYQRIVEKLIIEGRLKPFLVTGEEEYYSELFLQLENAGLIVTTDADIEWVLARPNGVNYIDYDRDDLDFYQVCLDIDHHHAYDLDENYAED